MRNSLGHLSGADTLALVLGLTCFWPMMRAPFLGTVFPSGSASSARLAFDVVVVAIGVCVLSGITSRGENPPCRFGGQQALAAGAATALGSVMLLAAAYFAPSSALLLLGAAMLGLGFSLLSVAWMRTLAAMPPTCARLACVTSFPLSFLFGIADFSHEALCLLAIAMPLLSGGALAVFGKRTCGDLEPWLRQGRECVSSDTYGALAAWAILGVAASGCVTSLWSCSSGYSMEPILVLTYVESLVLALALAVIEALVRSEAARSFFGLVTVTLLMVAGVCLCVVFGVSVSLGVVSTSRTCFEFCLWVAAMRLASRDARAVGLPLVVVFLVAALAGHLLPPLLGVGGEVSPEIAMRAALLCLVVMVVGLVVVACAILARRLRNDSLVPSSEIGQGAVFPPADEEDDAANDGVAVVVDETAHDGGRKHGASALGEGFGLTEREAEVALLVSRGNSVKRCSEVLCVAPSTVQSHMKSIYRKMGIHSRQELVDIVHDLQP